MKYNKPTIDVLGEAVHVIQGTKDGSTPDGVPNSHVPNIAYELDE